MIRKPSSTAFLIANDAWIETGDPFSRKRNRPSVWSRSASLSTTASIGDRRVGGGGWHLKWISCDRRSGDAFTNTQRRPSALIAALHWVRGSISPLRAASHWRHAQFHCGTPPPAADPNIWITIAWHRTKAGRNYTSLPAWLKKQSHLFERTGSLAKITG